LKLILSLDTSASMAGERLTRLRSGADALLGDLREGDRAALISFSHRVRVLEGLSHDLAAVRGRLDAVAPDGMTALNDALYTSLALAEGAAGRCALVLFSDGLDNSSWTSEADVLDAARLSPAVVYVVASSLAKPRAEDRKHVARDPREAFLGKLTDVTGGKVIKADSDADLVAAFGRVLPELRTRYVLRYAPQGVPDAGWHPIEVKLKGRKGEVRTRPGYLRAASQR
jgi:VWFA-related protein